jgi:hypothetical protein
VNRFRVYRTENNLTAASCAEALGIHPNTWRNWELREPRDAAEQLALLARNPPQAKAPREAQPTFPKQPNRIYAYRVKNSLSALACASAVGVQPYVWTRWEGVEPPNAEEILTYLATNPPIRKLTLAEQRAEDRYKFYLKFMQDGDYGGYFVDQHKRAAITAVTGKQDMKRLSADLRALNRLDLVAEIEKYLQRGY